MEYGRQFCSRTFASDPPPLLPPGTYYVQLGIYDRDTGLRWQIAVDDDLVGDRLLLREVHAR